MRATSSSDSGNALWRCEGKETRGCETMYVGVNEGQWPHVSSYEYTRSKCEVRRCE